MSSTPRRMALPGGAAPVSAAGLMDWSRGALLLRGAIAAAAATFALISATGAVQVHVFHQESTLKYAMTIVGPVLIMWAALSRYPLRPITGALIVAAPFESANAGVAGVRVSVIVPLLLAGALLAPIADTHGLPAAMRRAGLLAFPLLLLPLLLGTAVSSYISSLLLLLTVAWVVSVTAREPGGMTVVLAAVAVSASLQSVIALWEAHTGHVLNLYGSAGTQQFSPDYFYTYGTTRRPTGTFSDPISLGNFLALSLPLTIMLAAKVRNRGWRYVVAVAAMVIAAALVLSLSREAWIGGFVGAVIAVLLVNRRERMRMIKGTLIGAIIVCAVTVAAAGPAVIGRLSSISHPTALQGQTTAQQGVAQGDKNRLEYWHVAVVDAFGGHPLSGVGIGKLGPYLRDRVSTAGPGIRAGTAIFLHAHSTYFQVLAEAGLLGLILLALFLWGLVRDAWTSVRADPVLGPGLAGAAVALVIVWVTDWVVHNPPVAASVGVVLGAIAAGGGLGLERAKLARTARGTQSGGSRPSGNGFAAASHASEA
jgi:O-antigen ligase